MYMYVVTIKMYVFILFIKFYILYVKHTTIRKKKQNTRHQQEDNIKRKSQSFRYVVALCRNQPCMDGMMLRFQVYIQHHELETGNHYQVGFYFNLF